MYWKKIPMNIIIPARIKPSNDNEYFEMLSKSVFQAGFSFKVVEQKWPDIVETFDKFDFKKVMNWNEEKIYQVLQSPKIIRNSKKVRGIVDNARVFYDVTTKYGSFSQYLNSFKNKPYPERSKIISKQFKWLGKTGTYVFLWMVKEDVPEWENR